jgi:hypothetical protein
MINRLSINNIDISNRGKTIRNLIQELQSFENQDLEVKISFDCGENSVGVGLVGKIDDCCVLMNCED